MQSIVSTFFLILRVNLLPNLVFVRRDLTWVKFLASVAAHTRRNAAEGGGFGPCLFKNGGSRTRRFR
jgi:hypothetical protein